ncbi:uncharacterized protein LOC108676378 isoform X3 [Hyalella azteca]|uniref:Uncharacterized protein LOC108676378 isoform X3 n=1 Tax=Hyalella azteca TaxID=294128 RepID=A0A8B7P1P5_HYAAZ|nr:uncharacterized protein LOC108676378 isoform X3 [Hyalella azteca]
MSQPATKAVPDVTIVAGLGLANFRDDTLIMEEPSAASTAGHKCTRQDLIERKCAEHMAKFELKIQAGAKVQERAHVRGSNFPSKEDIQIGEDTISFKLLNSQHSTEENDSFDLTQIPRKSTQPSESRNELLKHPAAAPPAKQPVTLTRSCPVSNWGENPSFVPINHASLGQESAKNNPALHQASSRGIISSAEEPRRTQTVFSPVLLEVPPALGEISPPKSFKQRLWEAKRMPRLEEAVAEPALPPPCHDSRTHELQAPERLQVHSSCARPTQAVPRTVDDAQDESVSCELLSLSVLRGVAEDTSSTWLLPSPCGLSRSIAPQPSMLHTGEADDWSAPPLLKYTASDVPWNQPQLSSGGLMSEEQDEAAQVAELLEDEQFGALDIDELAEDERLCSTLMLPPSADITGLCEVNEITVRESWLGGRQAGVRRMPVDEYLMAGSLALGSLSGSSQRPSFGMQRPETHNQHSTHQSLEEGFETATAEGHASCERPQSKDLCEENRLNSRGGGIVASESACVFQSNVRQAEILTNADGRSNVNMESQSYSHASKLQLGVCTSAGVQKAGAVAASGGCFNELRLGREAPSSEELKAVGSRARECSKQVAPPTTEGLSYARVPVTSSHSDLQDTKRAENVSQIHPPHKQLLKKSSSATTCNANETSSQVERLANNDRFGRPSKLCEAQSNFRSQSQTNLSESNPKNGGIVVERSVSQKTFGNETRSLREQLAKRDLDAIKHALLNLRDTSSPGTMQSVVLGAVSEQATDCTASVNATLQESVLDASMEIELLRKQKEAIKSKFAKPSADAGRANLEALRKTTQQDAGLAACGSVHHAAQNVPSRQLGSKGLPVQKEVDVPNMPPPREGHEVLASRDAPFVTDDTERASLDDTIRLEPCLQQSQCVQSCFNGAHEDELLDLEETPAFHNLTLYEEPGCVSTCERVSVEGCVVGVSTWLSVPLHNPTDLPLNLHAAVISETFNHKNVVASSFVFKQGRVILPPRQNLVWALGICARAAGVVQGSLQLQLMHQGRQEPLVTHVVPITATATLPQVTIGDSRPLEVGSVPEGFTYDAQFEVHNKTKSSLRVVLSLVQAFSQPVFRLVSPPEGGVLSPFEVACDLAPGTNTFSMQIMAPNLSNVGNESKETIKMSCRLQVKLDSRVLPRPVLASESVSVDVVAVHLHLSRSCVPLRLQAEVDSHASAPLTLKNLSCIPLSLKLRCDDAGRGDGSCSASLAIVPDRLVIQPNALVSPVVVFTPLGEVTSFTATVVIQVEPHGLEYEIPVEVSSVLTDNKFSDTNTGLTDKVESSNKEDKGTELTGEDSAPAMELQYPIEASKTRLVFGCVDTGTVTHQKLSFCNRNSADLVLSYNVAGSPCFSVAEPRDATSIVVPAGGVAAVVVAFCPSSVDLHTAKLVCKPRGLVNQRVKYSIQLQGYGGRGALETPDQQLQLHPTNAGAPAILHLALTNPGVRAVCVAVSAHSDSSCSVRAEGVMVTPEELVLSPGQCQNLMVVVSADNDVWRGVGTGVGCLLLAYSEELLRRRYRARLAEGCSRALSVSRALPTDWNVTLRGEKALAIDDSLPSHPDDAKIFLASCRYIKVPVVNSALPSGNHEASLTFFSPLNADSTLSQTLTPTTSCVTNNTFPASAYSSSSSSSSAENTLLPTRDDDSLDSSDVSYKNLAKLSNQQVAATHDSGTRTHALEKNVIVPATASNDLNKSGASHSDEFTNRAIPDTGQMRRGQPALKSGSTNWPPSNAQTAAGKPFLSESDSERDETVDSTDLRSMESNYGAGIKFNRKSDENNLNVRCSDSNKDKTALTRQNREASCVGATCAEISNNLMSPQRVLKNSMAVNVPAPGRALQPSGWTSHDSVDKENRSQDEEEACFEVYPDELSIEFGVTAALVLVNKTNLQLNFQITCSHSCLLVEPVALHVTAHSSASARLRLLQQLHSPAFVLLTVKCNRTEQFVKVTCLPGARPANDLPEKRTGISGLEVGLTKMQFPITRAGKQSYIKLPLKNLSNSNKQVTAAVTSGVDAFIVKHPQFLVKVGHFVNVPVYFRPRAPGTHQGALRLLAGHDEETLVVLEGTCP